MTTPDDLLLCTRKAIDELCKVDSGYSGVLNEIKCIYDRCIAVKVEEAKAEIESLNRQKK